MPKRNRKSLKRGLKLTITAIALNHFLIMMKRKIIKLIQVQSNRIKDKSKDKSNRTGLRKLMS
jgi:hypothetical protein